MKLTTEKMVQDNRSVGCGGRSGPVVVLDGGDVGQGPPVGGVMAEVDTCDSIAPRRL